MTPQFSARQNKLRLIAVFLCTVLMGITFYVMRPQSEGPVAEAREKQADSSVLFMGLRHANPREIHAALPEAAGKPAMIAFSSRFCHDCQRMAPVISKLVGEHPHIFYRKIDVLEDKKKYPAVFRAFKPVSVPMLVLIDAKGEIRNVLYNYQPSEVVAKALEKIQPRGAKPAAAQKSQSHE